MGLLKKLWQAQEDVISDINADVNDTLDDLFLRGKNHNQQKTTPMVENYFAPAAAQADYSGRVTSTTPSEAAPSSTLADLAKMTYKEVYAFYKVAGTGDSSLSDWTVEKRVDELETGLDARMFVNDATHEIIICFEGSHGFTKLLAENVVDGALMQDLYTYSDGLTRFFTEDEYNTLYDKWKLVLGKDGLADLQMMANKVPDQFYTAYAWFKETMSDIAASDTLSSYKLVITGHSLGGSMAQMVSGKYYLDTGYAIPTIAMEGTGVLTLLEQVQGEELDGREFSNIVNVCAEGDPVGEFAYSGHLGFTVPIPYDLSRGDRPDALPNYRVFLEAFQKATGIEDIRLDRHEIGQQIDLFSDTSFTYPENHVMLGADEKSYKSSSDVKEIIQGNDLGNTIQGNDQSSYLVGGAGKDILIGGAADDYIAGGDGNDIIIGGAGNNMLYGGAGNDYLVGGKGNDELYGGHGDDTLVWTGGNDELYGMDGNNTYLLGNGQSADKASGTVTLKFDRENVGDAHVVVDMNGIDAKNTQLVFLMSDQILPSNTVLSQKDNSLCIQYTDQSSVTVDNWSDVQASLGDNITMQYLGDLSAKYSVQNNSLVHK